MHHGHTVRLLLTLLCFGSSVQSELETDVVVPVLLSRLESHLSDENTARRRLRSLDSPGTGPSYPDNILLSLPAFGRNLHLNLTRDNMFLSGGFVVEERRSDHIAAVSRLSTKQLCFYSGSIVNHTDSLASISTCGGLASPALELYVSSVQFLILPACPVFLLLDVVILLPAVFPLSNNKKYIYTQNILTI